MQLHVVVTAAGKGYLCNLAPPQISPKFFGPRIAIEHFDERVVFFRVKIIWYKRLIN
jgi:hypothetical protein